MERVYGAALAAMLLAAGAAPAAAQQPPAIPGLTLGFAIPKPPAIIFEAREVADLDRAVAFYTNVLGLKVVGGNEPPGTAIKEVFLGFDTEALSAKILLAHTKGAPAPKGRGAGSRLIISVPDLAGVLAKTPTHGGTVTSPPKGAVKIAHIADPDGYEIELTQP